MKITFIIGLASILVIGCGDDDGGTDASTDAPMADATLDATAVDASDLDASVPDDPAYAFESRFIDGASGVAYGGQAFRQLLIDRINAFIGGLTDDVDSGTFTTAAQVSSALEFYYRFDSDSNGSEEHGAELALPTLQTTWDDIGAANLVDKTAGNDPVTDHRDWNGGDFEGWTDASVLGDAPIGTPTELIEALFATLAANAEARAEGSQPTGPDGEVLPVYLTEDGLDLQQLIQKTLLMAVAFSQGTDDYLDSDVADKGLLASNDQDGESPYSTLEHAWDEGFGYFGAPRDMDMYTDDELASAGGRDDWQGLHDTNNDGMIDLASERAYHAAVNAAKRDRGAAEATDFTADAFDALVAGRALLAASEGALTTEQMTELEGHRDTIVMAWEMAIAATVVHYINDTLGDMDAFGTDEYSFEDHAKHWSEMKGFAIGLQFNPRSPMHEGTRFVDLHGFIGDRPVLANADAGDISDYQAALLSARDLLRDAYGFSTANAEGW